MYHRSLKKDLGLSLLLLILISGLTTAQEAPEKIFENHMGGYSIDCALNGDVLYHAHGGFLSVLDVSSQPITKVHSLRLSSECNNILLHDNCLYVFYTYKDTALEVLSLNNPRRPELMHRMPITSRFPIQGHFAQNLLFLAMDDSLAILDMSTPSAPQRIHTLQVPAQHVAVNDSLLAVATADSLLLYNHTVSPPLRRQAIALAQIKALQFFNDRLLVGTEGYPNIGLSVYAQDLSRLGFVETKIIVGNTSSFKNPRQIQTHGQMAYVGCSGSASLFVIDLTDESNPQRRGIVEFEEGSWPSAKSLEIDFPTAYMSTGSSDQGIIRFDLSNPDAPALEDGYHAPWDAVHLTALGDTLFLASMERIWTYQIASDGGYTVLGSDTAFHDVFRLGTGDHHLLALQGNTLTLIDYSTPNALQTLGQYSSTVGELIDVEAVGSILILLSRGAISGAVEWVDISNPAQPAPLAVHPFDGEARSLTCRTADSLVFAAVHTQNADPVYILNFKAPGNIQEAGMFALDGLATALCVEDTLALAGSVNLNAGTWALQSFNIKTPGAPAEVARVGGEGTIYDVQIDEGRVYTTVQGTLEGSTGKIIASANDSEISALLARLKKRLHETGGPVGPTHLIILNLAVLSLLALLAMPGGILFAMIPFKALGMMILIAILGFFSPASQMSSGSVGAMLFGLSTGSTAVEQEQAVIHQPESPVLEQNFPNPFNPVTAIRYHVNEATPVKLTVYDLTGKAVKILVDEVQQAGSHDVQFNGSALASGLYTCVLEMHGTTHAMRMLLIK